MQDTNTMDNLGINQILKNKQKQTRSKLENVKCLFLRNSEETENASHRPWKSIYKGPVSKLHKELHNSIIWW